MRRRMRYERGVARRPVGERSNGKIFPFVVVYFGGGYFQRGLGILHCISSRSGPMENLLVALRGNRSVCPYRIHQFMIFAAGRKRSVRCLQF